MGFTGTAAATTGAPVCSEVGYEQDGSGAYEVTNVSQLQCIGDDDDGPGLDKDYVLTEDIDASGTEDWNGEDGFEPIGEFDVDNDLEFNGTFNGSDSTISNLTINRSDESDVGLFGWTDGDATIEKVGLEAVDIHGNENVGGLVGINAGGDVSESYAAGTVTGDSLNVGGLIGGNTGDVHESYATGSVDGDDRVGGLVGDNSGDVSESYAIGNVTGDGNFVGGLVGSVGGSGEVSKSYATGNVTGESGVGGLIGSNSGDVSESYWDDQAATIKEDGDEVFNQSDGGQALRTVQMTGEYAAENMDEFDFGDTWDVVDDPDDGNEVSYPFLQDAIQDPEPGLQNRYAGGDGDADPYELTDWDELDHVRANLTANFTLTGDIDESTDGYDSVANETANDGDGFESIGEFDFSGDFEFRGTFNGSNNTISNLTIDRNDEDRVGLFGATDGDATIEGVGLEAVDIQGSLRVGTLVGENDGIVIQSYATGDINSSSHYVGGLVGDNTGTVTQSYATGAVDGGNRVGGLVGENSGDVSESYATSTVDGGATIGGTGGLVGINEGNVTESYATGDVDGNQDFVGGLVGSSSDGGEVTKSYATGDVDGNQDFVGGLVGSNSEDGEVAKSYATGDVDGNHSVGGLVGFNLDSDVSESYATGNVTDGDFHVGGLVGTNADGDVTDAYWNAETTNQDSSAGSPDEDGLTTTEMTGETALSELEGFDSSVWNEIAVFADDETFVYPYPTLAENTQDPAPNRTLETLDATGETRNVGEAGEINVSVTDADGPWGLLALEISDDDGLSMTETETDTDTEGAATFGFEEDDPGEYDVVVALTAGDAVTDTATVTIQASVLGIDPFTIEDKTEGDELTLTVTVEETAAVETDGLEVTLDLDGDTEGAVANETIADRELNGGNDTFAFDPIELEEADDYTARVNASADNAAEVAQNATFEVSAQTTSGGGGSGGSGGGESGPTPTPDEETPEPDDEDTETDAESDEDIEPAPDTDTEPVPDEETPEPDVDTETEDEQPGFGVLAGIIALLVASLLGRRRTQ